MLARIQSLCHVSACRHCHLPRKALCERDISYKLAPRMQGTCAFEAQNVIKLLTFDQVEKEKAAGQASTALSARLADLIQDYRGASLFRPPRAYPCSGSFDHHVDHSSFVNFARNLVSLALLYTCSCMTAQPQCFDMCEERGFLQHC